LLTLYKEVFGRERSEEDFRWKLLGRASSVDTVWVAADGERIVGQHAGIPMMLKLGDRVVPAMHAVEAMTHADYRREGMLTVLGGALYGHWREQDIPLVMGLPHPGWGSRAFALGYREAFTLRWISKPLDLVAILRNKLNSQYANAVKKDTTAIPSRHYGLLDLTPRDAAGKEFDALWQTAGPRYHSAVVRDAAWVRWRYMDAPGTPFTVLLASREGTPVGYIAYRVVTLGNRRIGRIADLFSSPDDQPSIRGLVRAATENMRARGADSAVALVAAGSTLYAHLRGQGFVLSRGEYKASFIPFSAEFPLEALNDPGRWLLTGGDFDVV
jgi:hypothetical protein